MKIDTVAVSGLFALMLGWTSVSGADTLKLLCTDQRNPSFTANVDFAASTVNGWRAKIDEERIFWSSEAENAQKRTSFNRRNGTFMLSLTKDRSVIRGQCEIAPKQSF